MLNFSQKWTSLPNDAYRPMLIYHTECTLKWEFPNGNGNGYIDFGPSDKISFTCLGK